jgi:membrane protease YdiL (CAAX protease family)
VCTVGRILSVARSRSVGPAGLLAGLGAAVVLRAVAARDAGAASLPAAALFAAFVIGLTLAGGWRPGRPQPASVVWGLAGGALLVAGPAAMASGSAPVSGASPAHVGLWLVVVSAVAGAEEALLRGALWERVAESYSPGLALAVSTVVFALMHVPLYGWRALPLDLGVGLLLGGLRAWTGGVGAPAVAHALADVVGGWL